jgi:hypothetical protein
MTFKNSNENVIYKAVTDTNDSFYLVTLDQIHDIVGEEDWIHGESNCLLPVEQSRAVGEQRKRNAKSKEEYYLIKVCKLAILLLLKIMVINGHTKLK